MAVQSVTGPNNDIGRLCTLDTTTGTLTPVGSAPFLDDMENLTGGYGFEFEQPEDSPEVLSPLIRITFFGGRNISIRASDGALASNDSPLTANIAISGIASATNPLHPEMPSTLYGIDLNTAAPRLWRLGGVNGNPSAATGILTPIGPLNLPTSGSTLNGFDISEDGTAYLNEARIPGSHKSFLHRVNLQTGTTSQIGEIGQNIGILYGMSVASSKIVARDLGDGPRDTIIDGGFHGGMVRIGFSPTMNLEVNAGEAMALRNIQIESADGITNIGGLLTASGCTFYRCTSSAIGASGGTLKLVRCTFTENVVNTGSGAALFLFNTHTRLNHCTFVNNYSPAGGAIRFSTLPLFEMSACVVAGNISGNSIPPDMFGGQIVSATACVIGDGNFSGITETIANQNNVGDAADPVAHNLAPLADYGGATWTMPPQSIGSALNRASTTNFTGDQRGFQINGLPDSGAAEFRGNSDLARYWNTDWDNDGATYGIELAVDTDPEFSDPSDLKNLRIRHNSGSPVMTFFVNPGARPFTRWVVKRSTDLVNFSEVIYSFDGPTAVTVVAPGIFRGTEGGLILLRDNPPNPAKAFYRLEAVLTP